VVPEFDEYIRRIERRHGKPLRRKKGRVSSLIR